MHSIKSTAYRQLIDSNFNGSILKQSQFRNPRFLAQQIIYLLSNVLSYLSNTLDNMNEAFLFLINQAEIAVNLKGI